MRERRLGTVLSYVHMILHTVITIAYVKILLHFIGQSEYGLYQTVSSIMAYLTIMQNSLSSGISRFYCKYKTENDTKKMENTLAIARKMYRILSIIFFVVGIIAIVVTNFVYKNSMTKGELVETIVMLVILIVNIIISVNNYVYVAPIIAEEKFIFMKSIEIISMVLQPLMVVVVIVQIPYAFVIVLIQFLLNIGLCVLKKYYAVKKLGVKIVYHKKDSKLTKEMLAFSAGVICAAIADQIFWKTDQLILAKMCGTTVVAVYSIGCQIYNLYMHFATSISAAFLPRVCDLYGDGSNIKPVSDLFIKLGRLAFLILSCILYAFILYGEEFILLWIGDGYFESYLVAVIVMIPFTIDLIQNVGLTILQVADKYSFRAKMYLTIAIINIVLTIILTEIYGMVGAAISTGISMFIGSGFIMNVYYAKVIGLNISGFWKEILKIFLAEIPIIIIGCVIKKIDINNSILQFLLHGSLYVAVFALVVYLFAFNEYEKKLVQEFREKIMNKHKK